MEVLLLPAFCSAHVLGRGIATEQNRHVKQRDSLHANTSQVFCGSGSLHGAATVLLP